MTNENEMAQKGFDTGFTDANDNELLWVTMSVSAVAASAASEEAASVDSAVSAVDSAVSAVLPQAAKAVVMPTAKPRAARRWKFFSFMGFSCFFVKLHTVLLYTLFRKSKMGIV